MIRFLVPLSAVGLLAITTGADEAARSEQVAVVEDGRFANWDEALEAALGAA